MKRKVTEKLLLRTAIYIRVSTEKQAREGDSVREQLASGEKYVETHENMILAGTYIDDGISGQKLKRDDFQRLLDDVRDGKIDLIVFTRLDRWFRNLRHYLNTQDILDKYGVSWSAIEQPYFDTSTPHGRAFVNNSMIWAELEAQNDSDRIISVFKDKVKNGEVLSGSTPIGYSIKDKHLVPNEEAQIAVAIFEFYRKTGNLLQTLHYMESEFNIVRSMASVKNMLRNKRYIGEYQDNKEFCPPIIDREIFFDVQRLLKINVKSGKKYDYIFSGLIICSECDHIMSAGQLTCPGHMRANGTRGTSYRYSIYRCRQNKPLKRCNNKKTIFESTLERTILARIRPELEKYIADYEVANAPFVRADAKRRTIESKLQKLKELFLNELITMEEFKIDR